ncbi:MAG TPA: hypothetical protein VE987_22930 [Polyangiaceae bacterium]|nr:hypothetical protein [Polyangiaceae bacterium]
MRARGPNRWPTFAALFAAAALCPAPSSAQTAPGPIPADASEAAAEGRFREASQAFDEGRVDEACAGFAESMRLFATLGTLLNLALCHERQGKSASAWLEFTHAAAWAGDTAQHDRGQFARLHATRLERALSRVQLQLPPDPAVRIEVDGEPIAGPRRLLPVFLDPGEHRIGASAPGRVPYESTVAVPVEPAPEGVVLRIPALHEAPAAAALPAHREATTRPSTRGRTLGLLLGGAGAVAVGVGAYFAVDGASRLGACSTGCDPGPARGSEIASLVFVASGAAALASGAWMVLSAPPATATAEPLRVSPQLAAGGAGVRVGGVW